MQDKEYVMEVCRAHPVMSSQQAIDLNTQGMSMYVPVLEADIKIDIDIDI